MQKSIYIQDMNIWNFGINEVKNGYAYAGNDFDANKGEKPKPRKL